MSPQDAKQFAALTVELLEKMDALATATNITKDLQARVDFLTEQRDRMRERFRREAITEAEDRKVMRGPK